jgi:hypothetical protein
MSQLIWYDIRKELPIDCESAKKLKECSTDRILSAHNAELDRIAEGKNE